MAHQSEVEVIQVKFCVAVKTSIGGHIKKSLLKALHYLGGYLSSFDAKRRQDGFIEEVGDLLEFFYRKTEVARALRN